MASIYVSTRFISPSIRLDPLQYRCTRAVEQTTHIELLRFEQCELFIQQRSPMLNVSIFEEMLVRLHVRWPYDILENARRVFPE